MDRLRTEATLPGAAEKSGPRQMTPAHRQRKLAAILFTDMNLPVAQLGF